MKKIMQLLMAMFLTSCGSNHKQQLINSANSVRFISDNTFFMENLKGYYTEISIRFYTDSSYTIICWGDRNSWLWNLRKDKEIFVSIPYNRSKGKNVEKDVELIKAFKKHHEIKL